MANIPPGLKGPQQALPIPHKAAAPSNSPAPEQAHAGLPLMSPEDCFGSLNNACLPMAATMVALFDPAVGPAYLGQSEADQQIRVGKRLSSFGSETEALKFARRQLAILGSPDLAIVKLQNGRYAVHKLEIPNFSFSDATNLNSYADLRASSLRPQLAEGQSLVALIGDRGSARFYSPQPSPRKYGHPANPPALSPLKLPENQRLAKLADLRKSVTQTIARLKAMNQDLGQSKDHRGVFSSVYRVITERGLKAFDRMVAAGDLRGAEFSASLYINFANRYFEAFDTYSRGDFDKVPEAWRSAFDAGRRAEANGYPAASTTEILSLSMAAHILNDLPQTLQDLGYPQAEDRAYLQKVFDDFNQELMSEKENILAALAENYGTTDIASLNTLGNRLTSWMPGPASQLSGKISDRAQLETFTQMRTQARIWAMSHNPQQIAAAVKPISDGLLLIPGGN